MIKKLIYDEWDEIYFYYGVFTARDYQFINSKLRCCHYEFLNPEVNYFQYFDELMSIYDDRNELQDETCNYCINTMNTASLDAYNFHIKDEILKMVKKMSKAFSFSIERVNCVKIFDADMLKKKSKLIVFIITESYLNSKFFEKDLDEAKSMNKEIIFLVDEKIKDFYRELFQKYKIFFVSEDVFYPWDFIYFIEKNLNIPKKV
jgi:hypothetical protein